MADCSCGNDCDICEGCGYPECECICDLDDEDSDDEYDDDDDY